jgi:hypothetical protein
MKNKGLHQYRLPTNPLEKRFAELWEAHNNEYPYHGFDTVDTLMSEDSYHPDFASDEERIAMATVIQWLGSPVGQCFLNRGGFAFVEGKI